MLTQINTGNHSISEQFERRINKVLKPLYKTENINYEYISGSEYTDLYTLQKDSLLLGYMALTSSKGRLDRFNYVIVYSPEACVRKVKVIQYNSTRGTEVTAKRWLKQFEGNCGDSLIYGKDIQALSGATYSASSITEDIPIVTQWVKEIINLDITIVR